MSETGIDFLCTAAARPVDDRTLRYIAAAQPPFEDLRDAASQLAGLMVLAGSGAKAATIDHPMVGVASERWRAACESVRALKPTPQSAHHHHHLLLAADRLGDVVASLREAGSFTGRLTTPLPLLKSAWVEITHAANTLPGFRTLDFEQACCAGHARQRKTLTQG